MQNVLTSRVFFKRYLLLWAFILCLAPLYFSFLDSKFHIANFFFAPEPLFWLGLTYLCACGLSYLIQDSWLNRLENIFLWLSRHSKVLGGLGVIALALVAYALNQKVFYAFHNSADEFSCYFLAECFRLKKWWMEQPDLWEFFKTVHVGNRDGKWFSVYPPGWPALYALGLQWGVQDWLNPVMAALSLLNFYAIGKRIYGKAASMVGITLLFFAPFFTFTSGTYFSHGTCLLMISIFGRAFINWFDAQDEKKRTLWAVVGATAIGWGLLTRYLTSFAFMVPLLGYASWMAWKKEPQLRRSLWIWGSIIALFFLLVFSHNYIVTGKPFEAPNHYDKRWERLGFRDDYTILDGLRYLIARYFTLMDWVPSIWMVLFFAGLSSQPTDPRYGRFFRIAFFYCPAAYFFYYSWGGNQFGPRYYFEGFPFLTLILADTLVRSWNAGGVRRKMIFSLMLISLINSGAVYSRQIKFFEESSRQRNELYAFSSKTLTQPSIVFIHGYLGDKLVMGEEDAIRNHPLLNGRILYAHDLGERNKELMSRYPDRVYYRGTYDRKTKNAVLERLLPV